MKSEDSVKAAAARAALTAHYEGLEARYAVRDTGDFESLVTPVGNEFQPFHRWFHLKEGYSHRLLARVVKEAGLTSQDSLRIYDPFSGSGTTALSALDMASDREFNSLEVWASEVNPWLHLLSSTKFRAAQNPGSAVAVKSSLGRIISAAQRLNASNVDPVPSLSTLQNENFFESGKIDQVMRLRTAIRRMHRRGNLDSLSHDVALVCLGSIVESAGRLRRDGRALRFTANKTAIEPFDTFRQMARKVVEDISSTRHLPDEVVGGVVRGDGRTGGTIPSAVTDLDLVLFSPPYPNNIDYTEVYKLESWALGLISSADEFRSQRFSTMRSHPSVKFDDDYCHLRDSKAVEVSVLLAPLVSGIPQGDRYTQARGRMILGYFDDMYQTIKSALSKLRSGGRLVYVVGNSAHGSSDDAYVVAADIVIAAIAESVGFKVDSIDVARYPSRRAVASRFLRESVVFCTAP